LKCKRKLDDNESFFHAKVLSGNIKITASCLQITAEALWKEGALLKEMDKVTTASYQSLKYIKASTKAILYCIRSDFKAKKAFRGELLSAVVSLCSVSLLYLFFANSV
jgi:hypothetical protein